MILVNAKSDPKICRIVDFRRNLYKRFVQDVMEKDYTSHGSVKSKPKMRTISVILSINISVNDLKGKIFRAIESAPKSAQNLNVQIAVVPSKFEEAKSLIRHAISILSSRATPEGEIVLVNEKGDKISEEDAFEAPLKRKQRRNNETGDVVFEKFFYRQNFKLVRASEEQKEVANNLDGVELSEKEIFAVVDDFWSRKGAALLASKSSLDSIEEQMDDSELSNFRENNKRHQDIGDKVLKKHRANIEQFKKDMLKTDPEERKRKPQNDSHILYTDILSLDPVSTKRIEKELQSLNKEIAEDHIRTHLAKVASRVEYQQSVYSKYLGISR